MTIRLFDTKHQRVRDFVPLADGAVSIYVCGPTVQSAPHIGHVRSALVYDILRRWLTHRGFDVTLVRNVTDIDDKVLVNAAAAQAEGGSEQWWALAYRCELEFTRAYAAIGVLPPTYEPRATANIPRIHALIRRLLETGHAYVADDGSGDVYFDVTSWADYGALTHQSVDDMEPADDADPRAKRDPRDFALWKGHKPDEPESASWPSPWGAGRPGWHIECSAMATHYLGDTFDIHGGGLDLRFPHHENELAQSAAAGDGFARYWVHNGLVSIDGQKMSKSLGNSLYAADLLAQASPHVVRYYLGSAHYRSTIDYHDGSLTEAEAALERITGFLDRADRRLEGTRFDGGEPHVPEAFADAMDDDLSVPQALAVLHDTVRAGNQALDGDELPQLATARVQVRAMVRVLGLDAESEVWNGGACSDREAAALESLVDALLDARSSARLNRDYAEADRLRDLLTAAGVSIEDTPSGAHWSLDGE